MPQTNFDNVNLIIRSKMLIDGTGTEPISQGLVAIAGKKIVFAGPAERAPSLPDARILDLPDACVLPGLIDMHVHPTYYWEETDAGLYTYDPEPKLVYSPVSIALLAAANLREALMAGVTTARDTASVNDIMFDVKRAIDKGLVPGPKVHVAGRLIVPTAGHCHYMPGLSNQADGPYGFRRAVREEVRAGADFIKLANNGADLTQEELDAAVDEAHRLGKKVACHTGRPPAQSMAIEAGVDTFEHGTPTPEEIDLAVEKGIAWTPTINCSDVYLRAHERSRKAADPETAQRAEEEYTRTQEYLERKRASMAYAMRAGLKLAAGTDSWSRDVRFAALADEIACLVDYGCTPMQAIQAATAWAAQAMGWNEIGTLEQGKLADVIAVPGDPLGDIRMLNEVLVVVREGEVVKSPGSGRVLDSDGRPRGSVGKPL